MQRKVILRVNSWCLLLHHLDLLEIVKISVLSNIKQILVLIRYHERLCLWANCTFLRTYLIHGLILSRSDNILVLLWPIIRLWLIWLDYLDKVVRASI